MSCLYLFGCYIVLGLIYYWIIWTRILNKYIYIAKEKISIRFYLKKRKKKYIKRKNLDTIKHSVHEDFLSSLTLNGFPPHELILKPNCPIVLLRNINLFKGLCNGTCLICWRFDQNVIEEEISVGHYHRNKVFYLEFHSYLLKMKNISSYSSGHNFQFT